MSDGKKKRKGFFSDLRLPVVKEYIYPESRNTLVLVGGVGALAVLVLFLLNGTVQSGSLVSNGPLSSNHAALSSDCASCHTPFDTVVDNKCEVCHEKFGDTLGSYSFSSHYLYRSGDFSRDIPSPDEVSCYSCHPEHQGQDADLIQATNSTCATCHEYSSFNKDHPEFEFARDRLEDPANLRFQHTQHVSEVIKLAELSDSEQSCLYCHHADNQGKNFQPIDFEVACAACHISSSVSTDWLPIARSENSVGVQTLAAIQTRQAPASRWADYMNPSEFQERRDDVRKRPIYHRDPWVLANLKRIQDQLFAGRNDLAELLRAAASVDTKDARALYSEALATLEVYADELRASPSREVQRALEEIDDLIRLIKQRLRDPYSPLDETKFMLGADDINPSLNSSEVDALKALADQLTGACQTCHVVSEAAIKRVQRDQRSLIRSEFNHRAHIIQRSCLECHSGIPIREYAARDSVAAPEIDHAGIQNLPTIESCQTCHAPSRATTNCISCHLFHPDKSQHSNLLRYLE